MPVVLLVALYAASPPLLLADEDPLASPPAPDLETYEPPSKLFPAIDFTYASYKDDISLKSLSARIGLGIAIEGPNDNHIDWLFPSFRFFNESADPGIVRRGCVVSFEWHAQYYKFPFNPGRYSMSNEELRALSHRPAFPMERITMFGAVVGGEVGYVNAERLFSEERENGVRVGVRGSLTGFYLRISANIAGEFYDGRFLRELGIAMTVPTALPVGIVIGYRHSSTEGFRENAFVVGFEANF